MLDGFKHRRGLIFWYMSGELGSFPVETFLFDTFFVYLLSRSIIVPGRLITSAGVVLVVLVLVFVVNGGGFFVVVAVVACHYVYYH